MTQTKKRLGLSVPINLYEKISDRAAYQGKTINSLCLDAFWEYFEKKQSEIVRESARKEIK